MTVLFKVPTTLGDLATFVLSVVLFLASHYICDRVGEAIIGEARPIYTSVTELKVWLRYAIAPPLNIVQDVWWGIIMVPIIEELLFFALPLVTLGPLAVYLLGAPLFALAHCMPILDVKDRLPPRLFRRVLTGLLVTYVPPALLGNATLWVLGYGYMSIILHMLVNASSEVEVLKAYRQVRKSWAHVRERWRSREVYTRGYA